MLKRFIRWLYRQLQRFWRKGKRRRQSRSQSLSSSAPASGNTLPAGTITKVDVTGQDDVAIGSVASGGKAIGKVERDAYIDSIINYINNPLPPPLAIGIPNNLLTRGAVKFVGRDADLERLHTELQQADSLLEGKAQRLAITAVQGMGGIGKTELALQYAQSHHQQGTYPGGVCWLEARNLDIGPQITRFAIVQLGLSLPDDDQVAFCWRHWRSGDVLIVLDDVTDYEKIAPYLPPAELRFKVLMTTRLQLGRSVQQVEINVLEEPAALELLKSLTGAKRIELQLETAKILCRWLGYLPLGLELVGRYLATEPDLSLITLQQRLEKQRLAAQVLIKQEAGMTATHESLAAAFELSWQELDEPACQLSYLLSLFALAPIPWSLVESCWPDGEAEDLEETRRSLGDRKDSYGNGQ